MYMKSENLTGLLCRSKFESQLTKRKTVEKMHQLLLSFKSIVVSF